jgi:hypothetical protein
MRSGVARPACQMPAPEQPAKPRPGSEGGALALAQGLALAHGLALARSTAIAWSLLLASAGALAQLNGAVSEPNRTGKPPMASRGASPSGITVGSTPGIRSEAGPVWGELSADQQAALRPLAGSWASLNADQKRKWLAVSRNHAKLSPDERTRLQGRMSSWAALSPAERAQARLNFSESRELSAQDKSAQWEAYQSLPPERKKELARQQPAKPSGASVASAGTPKLKLAPVPVPGVDQAPRTPGQRRPKPKLVAGDNLNANTLLPQQAPDLQKNPRP